MIPALLSINVIGLFDKIKRTKCLYFRSQYRSFVKKLSPIMLLKMIIYIYLETFKIRIWLLLLNNEFKIIEKDSSVSLLSDRLSSLNPWWFWIKQPKALPYVSDKEQLLKNIALHIGWPLHIPKISAKCSIYSESNSLSDRSNKWSLERDTSYL